MRRCVPNLILVLAGCCGFLGADQVPALSSDRQQVITVEADLAEADDARRVTVYKGSVIITQGSLRISGDTATIHYNRERDLTALVVVGKPAHFRQQVEGQLDYQQATAQRMEYHADKNLIILLGNAQSWQGREQITGDRIVFDTVHNRVQADARATTKASGKPRVRITIVPKKE
ncbi:MAG: lipopolysaccharide transport periplasmic protein LptA [Gammaproteobacteria bacterium]|jgi:lipopolysaccharide export system protein LptA